jgi:spermidine/putrescine transport system substrate-binding protein
MVREEVPVETNARPELNRLLAGAPGRRLTRRDLLRRVGVGAGAVSATAWLAACGIQGESAPTTQGNGQDALTTNKVKGQLDIANWPLYIDQKKGRRPTLIEFEKATGIEVTYKEVIQDNQEFFGVINAPLSEGQRIEYDMIVMSDWMITKLVRLGYLEEVDHSRLPNFRKHAGAIYKDPVYDPGNRHSVPWQSGITGIGYNPKLTGREITSANDLFDPEFKGEVGMFTDMRDTMCLTLLSMGVAPEEATNKDAEAAQKKLLEQRDAGIVRQYYGNEYADALARGDLALTMAWSGDVFQLQFDDPDLQFVVPEEGAVLFVDNMAIPQGAPHPIDAMKFMNFVYQPEIAAQIAAWVNYICPVPAAQSILKKKPGLKEVATSPLVFPTPEMESRLHHYTDLDDQEEEYWNDLFNQVVQG